MPLNHPEYAHGISDADLIKEAIEFCNEELDGFNGMEYDSDSEVCCQRSNTFIRELVHRMFVAREAFRAGWKVNAVGTDVHSQEYLDGCEAVDWDEFIKANPGRAVAFYDAAALAAAEERGRREERERCARIAADMAPFTEETISTATAGAILIHAFDVTLSRFARRISAAITKEPTP